jgi:uncharacterized protein
MEIYKAKSPFARKSNWFLSLLVLVLITFGVMVCLQAISLLISAPLFDIDIVDIQLLFTDDLEHPNGRMAILFIQGFSSGVAFLISALVVTKILDKADLDWQQQVGRFKFSGLFLTILIMFSGILFNSLLIQWNAGMTLPEALSGVERFMRENEDELLRLTKYLTDFQDVGEFLMGLLVIGILAGVGEEVLFRGVVQPKLKQYTGNPHIAIWLTAFIFSAIHIQFYGLLPRMFLGAVFGYLYYYSGSLIYPIIAHILNNGFTVVLLYLNKLGKLNFDIEDTEQVEAPYALLGLFVMLLAFRMFHDKQSLKSRNEKLEEGI